MRLRVGLWSRAMYPPGNGVVHDKSSQTVLEDQWMLIDLRPRLIKG
jgi:hypothetical protein